MNRQWRHGGHIRPRARLIHSAVFTLSLLLASVGTPALQSGAQAVTQVVQQEVSSATPDVNDGTVYAIAKSGSRVYLGGDFTNATSRGSDIALSRNSILAFAADTGILDQQFLPILDGAVNQIEVGPDNSIYIAGSFKTVNGQPMRVARVDAATGAVISGWNPPAMSAATTSLIWAGDTLYVGGIFVQVAGLPRGGLVALNASTGVVQDWFSVQVSGQHGTGEATGGIGPKRIDLSPDGKTMAVIGNFINAQDPSGSVARDQVLLVAINQGVSATVRRDWNTLAFSAQCANRKFASTVRDVKFSPDSRFFAIASTGAEGINIDGTRGTCDSVVRFETDGVGTNVRPTWTNDTGRDSLWSVDITDTAVYVGGHQRWMNNSNGRDNAGPGAVPRPGIAALDRATGTPYSWNPGRNPRGAGAFAVLATDDGLYVGSDTDWVGNFQFKRKRISYFPIAGGVQVPAREIGALPGTAYIAGYSGSVTSASRADVLYRVNAGGPAVAAIDNGPGWAADTDLAPSARHNSGGVAAEWGPSVPVDPSVPSSTPAEIFDSERWDQAADPEMEWNFPVPSSVGVSVRLYFADRCTCTGAVGQRKFNVDIEGSRVLSDFDIVASGGKDRGIVRTFAAVSDGQVTIRFGHSAQMPMINGIEILQTNPVPTPPTTTTTPALVARSLGGTPNVGPTQLVTAGVLDWTAVRGMFAVDNTVFYGLTNGTFHRRTFDGRTLGPDVVIDPYNDPFWSDKSTGKPNQTFRGVLPGLYGQFANVTSAFFARGQLYYTLAGRTNLFYRSFNPESGIMGPIETTVVDGLNWSGVSSAFATADSLYFVTSADGVLRRYAWDGSQASGPATVVDSSTSWAGRSIFLRSGFLTPPKQADPVTFRAADTASANAATSVAVTVPPSVQPGDALLLFTSINLASTSTDPSGWTLVGTRTQTNAITTKVYQKVASAADSGAHVSVTYPAAGKLSATVVAYSGADRTAPVTAIAASVDADTSAHSTPPVIIPATAIGGRALSFWVDKSAAPATSWTVPSGTTRRTVTYGEGSGSLSTQLAETSAVLVAGTAPSRTASVNVTGGKGLSWTILLKPASAR